MKKSYVGTRTGRVVTINMPPAILNKFEVVACTREEALPLLRELAKQAGLTKKFGYVETHYNSKRIEDALHSQFPKPQWHQFDAFEDYKEIRQSLPSQSRYSIYEA